MTNGESVKGITSKFDKLAKFEGQDFRRWQKKMYFLLTTLKVVYVLSTPSPVWSENETLETNRKRMKWAMMALVQMGIRILKSNKDDEVARGLIRMDAKFGSADRGFVALVVGGGVGGGEKDGSLLQPDYQFLGERDKNGAPQAFLARAYCDKLLKCYTTVSKDYTNAVDKAKKKPRRFIAHKKCAPSMPRLACTLLWNTRLLKLPRML
uniref:Zinc finger, CCHC-type n=1 Tax=Tanacetum cinerariifolium TaxID=118510 RepID=A0A6L2JN88_TANCI|nr:zinc finger, CCHC-type [Tanacetum cinerariifolium]